MEISDSFFIGGGAALHAVGGTVIVSDSYFQSMTSGLLINSADSVQITGCSFTTIGELHGPFIALGWFGSSGVVDVSDSGNVSMADSVFASYTPGGFVVWTDDENVVMSGNRFEIDTAGYFTDLYGFNFNNFQFIWQFAAVGFTSCGDVDITENAFTFNELDSGTAWIYLDSNTGTNCLSANKLSV